MKAMIFEEAINKCLDNQKIIFGTRSEMFHIIDNNDRDFNNGYASTKLEAIKLGESGVKQRSIEPKIFLK